MTSRLVLPLLALLVAGCGKPEEVRRYRAPKEPVWRMIAAMAPGPEACWFFKASGPEELVGPHVESIEAFLRKLKLEEGEVRWTLPEGWTQGEGSRDRQATIRFGAREPKVELSVVRLPGNGGGTLRNVNRWREQMGLGRIGQEALDGSVRKIEAEGLQVTLVDLRGPKRPSARPRMADPGDEGQPTLDDVRGLFAFELPPGWRENPEPLNRGGFERRIFEFRAGPPEAEALVTFSMYQGEMGGLAANLNRWRQQAGLDPVPDDQAGSWTKQVKFLGRDAWSTEAVGEKRGILVTFLLNEQFSMFLKMDGPPATVGAQRAAFESLSRSFRMGGSGG